MGKIISVIIPYYKETERDIFPLLASVSGQVGVDFSAVECIMVNDGAANELSPDFLELFAPLEFRFVMLKDNKGPGVARQAGIDAATGDYLLFCDADDMLQNYSALHMFMCEALNQPDIILTQWLEEKPDSQTGAYTYMPHSYDETWMHGKLFRRQYLIDNNIRFHPELRVNEDTYFITIACSMTERIVKVPMVTYVWRYRKNSITRINGSDYRYTAFPAYIDMVDKCFKALIERVPHVVQIKVIHFIMFVYFSMQRPHWKQPAADSFRAAAENAFRDMIKNYLEYFNTAEPSLLLETYNGLRPKLMFDGIEEESLDCWLNRVL